jgi:hypothetical protein
MVQNIARSSKNSLKLREVTKCLCGNEKIPLSQQYFMNSNTKERQTRVVQGCDIERETIVTNFTEQRSS